MRWLKFDPDEFDKPDSEEFLELAISDRSRHADLTAFLMQAKLATQRLPPAAPASRPLADLDMDRRAVVCNYLRGFAGIDLPLSCPVTMLNDEWDDLELAIELPQVFIHYHWFTTA